VPFMIQIATSPLVSTPRHYRTLAAENRVAMWASLAAMAGARCSHSKVSSSEGELALPTSDDPQSSSSVRPLRA
jgi:hypothetical protein